MNIYRWNEMKEDAKEDLLKRAELDITQQMQVALDIISEVKQDGDRAVCRFTKEFDQATLTPENIKVTQEEIAEGYNGVSKDLLDTLQFAAQNIRKFHSEQLPKQLWFTETVPGVMVGEQTNPISDVCIYVPRGKGSFPSVLLMLAIPALVAGVPRVFVVTPPNPQGKLDDAVLAAAKVAGVTEIYKVGGVQAVAAVAYGTETIPRASKIIGPGNSY